VSEKTSRPVPAVDKAYPNDLREAVAHNARQTSHPGNTNGPADAYRHMFGIAEVRRRSNHPVARGVGDYNEREGMMLRLKTDADSQMDLHNNRIGERSGRIARNTAEVEARVHAEVRAAAIEGGTGKNGTAVYLPPEKWAEPDPKNESLKRGPTVWPPPGLAGSSEVERILGKPIRLWTEEDARKVMQDRSYTQSNHPRRDEAFEKVRKHFEFRHDGPRRGRAAADRTAGGGPVQVDAYTRGDGTNVDAHTRSNPGPR
jgi:hypothetical protein